MLLKNREHHPAVRNTRHTLDDLRGWCLDRRRGNLSGCHHNRTERAEQQPSHRSADHVHRNRNRRPCRCHHRAIRHTRRC